MSENLQRLRGILSERGSLAKWWQAVELVTHAGGESPLLEEYLMAHATRADDWRDCRLACGQWPSKHPGYRLCEATTHSISGLPEAVEIFCPPGSFQMGTSPGDKLADLDEHDAHEVVLTKGFWALSTPVTQAMYEAITGESPSHFSGPRRPVEGVSWWDAVRFCNQLSEHAELAPAFRFLSEDQVEWQRDADGYRLPTEAEWEYLCRAGCHERRYGAKLGEIAWHSRNSGGETHPVGRKRPNAWGFCDTLGNVFEWCMDGYGSKGSGRPLVDPVDWNPAVAFRMFRGGAWCWGGRVARASRIGRFHVNTVHNFLGFRVVRTAQGMS